MTEAVRDLLAAAESGWRALWIAGETRDSRRLRAAVEAVKAEEKPQTQPIKDHPLYAEITGQVHHVGGKQ